MILKLQLQGFLRIAVFIELRSTVILSMKIYWYIFNKIFILKLMKTFLCPRAFPSICIQRSRYDIESGFLNHIQKFVEICLRVNLKIVVHPNKKGRLNLRNRESSPSKPTTRWRHSKIMIKYVFLQSSLTYIVSHREILSY